MFLVLCAWVDLLNKYLTSLLSSSSQLEGVKTRRNPKQITWESDSIYPTDCLLAFGPSGLIDCWLCAFSNRQPVRPTHVSIDDAFIFDEYMYICITSLSSYQDACQFHPMERSAIVSCIPSWEMMFKLSMKISWGTRVNVLLKMYFFNTILLPADRGTATTCWNRLSKEPKTCGQNVSNFEFFLGQLHLFKYYGNCLKRTDNRLQNLGEYGF